MFKRFNPPPFGSNRVKRINRVSFEILNLKAMDWYSELNILGILYDIPNNKLTISTPPLGANRIKRINSVNFEILNLNAMTLKFGT